MGKSAAGTKATSTSTPPHIPARRHPPAKWAFVSDYARFLILYRHGGIYFDTDVEVIRPIDHITAAGASWALKKPHRHRVASGLGIGAPAGHPFYKNHRPLLPLTYLDNEGRPLPGTVVAHVTRLP